MTSERGEEGECQKGGETVSWKKAGIETSKSGRMRPDGVAPEAQGGSNFNTQFQHGWAKDKNYSCFKFARKQKDFS